MSSSDRTRGGLPGTGNEPPAAPAPSNPSDPYASWLDRMQRARARHAAITKNLYTWSNYKNWADKMRDNWEEDDPNAKGAGVPGGAKAPLPPRK